MVKGRGSAELFGDPERPSSQMKGIVLGKESAHARGMKCGQSLLAWHKQTQDSSRQKKGRGRSKRILQSLFPSTSLHAGHVQLAARVQ